MKHLLSFLLHSPPCFIRLPSALLSSALRLSSAHFRGRLTHGGHDNLIIIRAAEKITRRRFIVEHESMTAAVKRVDDTRYVL